MTRSTITDVGDGPIDGLLRGGEGAVLWAPVPVDDAWYAD